MGPMALAAAAEAPQMPNAIERSWPRYFATSSDAVAGIISAAPNPSMIDSPMSSVGRLRLIDARNDPAANTIAPTRNIFLRPNRSPMRPPVTVSAASVSEYAEMTHCNACSVVCNSRTSVDSDTLRSVVSMMMIASASERTRSGAHFFMASNAKCRMQNAECHGCFCILHSAFCIRARQVQSHRVDTTFAPAWWLSNPHAQTVWPRLARSRRQVAFRRESLTTPDGDELILDHVEGTAPVTPSREDGEESPATSAERASVANPSPFARLRMTNPHFILLHGLEGSSHSISIQGPLSVIARRGFSATAVNWRSCARDPENVLRSIPNRRPRFYHSGETTDFDFVAHTLARRNPDVPLVAFGVSLGGNALLKWLGEHPSQSIIAAAATLSVPYDLGAGAKYLERGAGPLYVSSFLRT